MPPNAALCEHVVATVNENKRQVRDAGSWKSLQKIIQPSPENH